MKKIFIGLLACICLKAKAQNNLTNQIIEGGKVFVDIIRVFKPNKKHEAAPAAAVQSAYDSCRARLVADLCYKNSSGKSIYISLYKRNGNSYNPVPLTLAILNNSKECLYEIQAGIYKYKLEYEVEDKKAILKEGEIKIQACDKKLEEIK